MNMRRKGAKEKPGAGISLLLLKIPGLTYPSTDSLLSIVGLHMNCGYIFGIHPRYNLEPSQG